MHIELTDHLRCPRQHAEAFLVLLPGSMESRSVVAGHLGCPICGWSTAWTDGVPDFGGGWRAAGQVPFDAHAAQAMLGIDGPGGWIALGGSAGTLAHSLRALVPGVSLVVIDPPEDVDPSDGLSIVLSGPWPLKRHSMRGALLGADADHWNAAAIATTLPGLRTVGCGQVPATDGVQILGNADGVWVATHR